MSSIFDKVTSICRRPGSLAVLALLILGPPVGWYICPRLLGELSRFSKPRLHVKPRPERELRLRGLSDGTDHDAILKAITCNGKGERLTVQLMSLTPSLDGEHRTATVYLQGLLSETTEKEVVKGRLSALSGARVDENFHDFTPVYWPADKWTVEYVEPSPPGRC